MKYVILFSILSFLLVFVNLSFAEDASVGVSISIPASTTIIDVKDGVKNLQDAFKNKHWGVAIGLMVMVLVSLFRGVVYKLVNKKIPTKCLPWIAVGIGLLISLSSVLIQGGSYYDLIWNSLEFGLIACGLYSAGGKLIPGIKTE